MRAMAAFVGQGGVEAGVIMVSPVWIRRERLVRFQTRDTQV